MLGVFKTPLIAIDSEKRSVNARERRKNCRRDNLIFAGHLESYATHYFEPEPEKNPSSVSTNLTKVIDEVKVRRFSGYLWRCLRDGYVLQV